MSEDPQQQSPYDAPAAEIAPGKSGKDPRGSRWAGFGWFWLITIIGNFAFGGISGLLGGALGWYNGGLMSLLALLPWLTILGLGIWFAAKGKTATALGLLFGFLSLIGLALLLVAACFGIIAFGGGLGPMH